MLLVTKRTYLLPFSFPSYFKVTGWKYSDKQGVLIPGGEGVGVAYLTICGKLFPVKLDCSFLFVFRKKVREAQEKAKKVSIDSLG